MDSDKCVIPHPYDELEPILNPENLRYATYPIKHPDIYYMYEKINAVHWNAKKIDFSSDYSDYKTLNKKQRKLVKNFSEIFAVMDGYIADVIRVNFASVVCFREAIMLYNLISSFEDVHNETYSIMRNTFIPNKNKHARMENGISSMPAINKLKDWLGSKMLPHISFAEKVVSQAFFEGVILLTLFTIPYQIKMLNKESNKLPGFIRTNEYINRDEMDHSDTGVLIYSKLVNKLQDESIYNIANEVIDVLEFMVSELFDVEVIGLNASLMKEHARYLSDKLMTKLGVQTPLFGVKSTPITYMASVGLEDDSSFFEVEVTNYQDPDLFNKNKNIKYDLEEFF